MIGQATGGIHAYCGKCGFGPMTSWSTMNGRAVCSACESRDPLAVLTAFQGLHTNLDKLQFKVDQTADHIDKIIKVVDDRDRELAHRRKSYSELMTLAIKMRGRLDLGAVGGRSIADEFDKWMTKEEENL